MARQCKLQHVHKASGRTTCAQGLQGSYSVGFTEEEALGQETYREHKDDATQRDLRATVRDIDGRRVIEISMSPARSPPLASIGPVSTQGNYSPRTMQRTNSAQLEVTGPRGAPYGVLKSAAGLGYVLACGDDDVMSLMSDRRSSQLVLYATGDGAQLAKASRCCESDFFEGVEYLEVRVNPGVDAVLVLLCVLAVILFGGGQGLPIRSTTGR